MEKGLKPSARIWRVASALAVLGALIVSGPGRAQEQAVEEVPIYLEGIDASLPAQEAFRDWPPDSLIHRYYGLPWSWAAFRRASLFGRPVMLVLTVDWSRASQRLLTETRA